MYTKFDATCAHPATLSVGSRRKQERSWSDGRSEMQSPSLPRAIWAARHGLAQGRGGLARAASPLRMGAAWKEVYSLYRLGQLHESLIMQIMGLILVHST